MNRKKQWMLLLLFTLICMGVRAQVPSKKEDLTWTLTYVKSTQPHHKADLKQFIEQLVCDGQHSRAAGPFQKLRTLGE